MQAARNRQRAIVTVVTRNYAHFAQVLLHSCRQHHPEADLYVMYVDRPPASWREQTPGTHVLHADELNIPDWSRYAFQYTPFELAVSLKPHALAHLQQLGYEKIVFLDGDMQLYGPMHEVFDALEHSSIVVTPHLLKPLTVDAQTSPPEEATYLAAGAYNSGFVAVRSDRSGCQFTAWWRAMHRELCIIDFAQSIFVDQGWMSLVPGMFDGVHILREPGYNTGHWSFGQFAFTELESSERTSSGVAVDGRPLILLHFSGLTANKPKGSSGSALRKTLSAFPFLERLVDQNNRDLESAGMSACKSWGCAFATMKDGTPIHPAWREAVRRNHPTLSQYEDPFDNIRHPELLRLFRSLESGSHRWRRDWQLQWSKAQGLAGKAKAATKRVEGMVRNLLRRNRAA